MASKNAPLVKELVTAMKEAGFATKEDVKEIVFNELTEFHTNMIKPEFEKGLGKLEVKIDKIDRRLSKVEADISFIKDDIKGLKADLSNTPTREEFEKLKH